MPENASVFSDWRRIVVGDTFRVSVPPDWDDITDSLTEIPNVPWTLAAEEGTGALQFTAALYRRGPRPSPAISVLLEWLQEFAAGKEMGPLESVVLEEGPPTLAAGTLTGNDVQVRAWYVSKNGSYAFVTYTGDLPLDTDELCVCERIVRSIEFEVHNETQR